MKNYSILEKIRRLDIKHDQLREWLHMDYFDEEFEKIKDKMIQNHQKNNEFFLHLKESFLNRSRKVKKIHIKDMDVVSLFNELIRKNKVSIEEAELYINEWFHYAKKNCHSKKLTKKYILLIMSLLLMETTIVSPSAAEMIEMQDTQMDDTTGKAGISIVMSDTNGRQTQKDINLNQFDKKLNSFLDSIKAKIDNQEGNEIVIDMDDMARDFESVQIISPAGGVQLDNLSLSGSGKARIRIE